MHVRSYIVSKYIFGTEASNVELIVRQLADNGVYDIQDPIAFIAEHIYYSLDDFLSPNFSISSLRQMLQVNGKHNLPLYSVGGSSVSKITLMVDTSAHTYYYDVKSNFISRQIYEVMYIPDEQLGYLVPEHLVRPYANCYLIERCYHEVFTNLVEAEQYQQERMADYAIEKGSFDSGYRLLVVNREEMEKSEWYKKNMKVAHMIEQYDLDYADYRYIRDMDDVILAIEADSYDSLSPEGQTKVNKQIYQQIRKYVPDDYVYFMDQDIEVSDAEYVESMTDQAILLALIHASSEEVFKEIHDALGPNEYRVGALTDDIYNANPNRGFILVDKSGDMGWYPACNFIQEARNGPDIPYYNKFQPNERDTLLCLREYHPELIVDHIPKKAEIDQYKTAYYNEIAKERAKHKEFYFDSLPDGELAVGDWYPNGIWEDAVYHEASFPRKYGSYVFTEEQCHHLLNGEEIVVDGYVSKAGIVTRIRGKLDYPYDMYTAQDGLELEFTRTDIGSKDRSKVNAAMGITEKGL